MGLALARPKVGCRFGPRSTKEARGVQYRVSVGRPVRQDYHRGDDVHAMRHDVALLVAVQPVKGESTPRRVVCSPLGLVAGIEARSCNQSLSAVGKSWHWSRYVTGGRKEKGRRRSHVRSTCGGSCVVASTPTFRSVIQCDGEVTTLMAEVGKRRWPPETVA